MNMPHIIKKLPDDLINKIAAGEVVERPAAVVKELIENSLDAGSSRIIISLKDGGKKLIQITDDGLGMPPGQLQAAVSRHATSKIQKFDDIYSLKTKGFRGEALASICSVAKVTLSSKTESDDASEIIVEGGKIIDQRACAQAQGTTVTVKYLFYQTPARLKFLKTTETETSHAVNVVTKMALSHPTVAFTLMQNDRSLLEVSGNQTLKERVLDLLGKDLSEYLYDFSADLSSSLTAENENAPVNSIKSMKISGFLGHPQIAKSQRSFCYFFVNGRAVSDKVLWHAVMEAYRDLLMKGKYPVMVFNLWVDENMLDVNVHPTKSEIRFHQSQQVHHFVYHALRQKLKEAPWLESGHSPRSTVHSPSSNVQYNSKFFSNELTGQENKYLNSNTRAVDSGQWTVDGGPNQRKIQFGKTQYGDMSPIGQLFGTYILCDADSKLIMIDQHAAHERIGFEKLMLHYKKDGIPQNSLLIPETFDLKPSDADILKKYLDEFQKFGFEIEFFGGNTFVLKSLPTLLENKINIVSFITDLIEDIKATGELVSLKDKLHHILATMACHAQIRAHHHLSHTEMQSLLKELDEYQFTDFCPHGRPVSVEVTLEEIERWFKRVI